jgi:hypothetical protein
MEHVVTEIDFILTPLAAGRQTIGPAILQVGILRRRAGQRSPFDDFFNRSSLEHRVLQTETVPVDVRPLPWMNVDRPFSGLVGRFDLAVSMEKTDLKVGDSATLAVTVEGRGNVMDARAPEIGVPPAFKSYADNPEAAIRTDRRGTMGKKVFRTALVPMESGRYSLPPVSLVYFDTEQETYRTVTATIPPLTVAPSEAEPAAPVAVSPAPLPPLKKRVAFTGRDILPPKESLEAISPGAPLRGGLFFLVLAAPAALYLVVLAAHRLRRPDQSPAALMKARSRRALKQARSAGATAGPAALYQALTATILAAAGRKGETLTWKEARNLLIESGLPESLTDETARLLSRIESLTFSGTVPDTAEWRTLLDAAKTIMGKLNR